MKLLLLVVVLILVITVCLIKHYLDKTYETFDNVVDYTVSRPCNIYYTKNIDECDKGVYSHPILYYQSQQNEINNAILAQGGVPTAAQISKATYLKQTIAEINRLQSLGLPPQTCSINLQNWNQYKDPNGIGPIPFSYMDNTGDVSSWASCINPATTASTKSAGSVNLTNDKLTVDGVNSSVINISSLAYQSITPFYCSQKIGSNGVNLGIALIIDISKTLSKTMAIVNGSLTPYSSLTPEQAFALGTSLYTETISDVSGKEVVTMTPVLKTASVVIQTSNVCGNFDLTTKGFLSVQMSNPIIIKSIDNNSANQTLLGGISTVSSNLTNLSLVQQQAQTNLQNDTNSLEQLQNSLANSQALYMSVSIRAQYNPSNYPTEMLSFLRPDDGTNGGGDASLVQSMLTNYSTSVSNLQTNLTTLQNSINSDNAILQNSQTSLSSLSQILNSMQTTFTNEVISALSSNQLQILSPIDISLLSYDNNIYIQFI